MVDSLKKDVSRLPDPTLHLLDMLDRSIQAFRDAPTRREVEECRELIDQLHTLVIGERGDNGLTSRVARLEIDNKTLVKSNINLKIRIREIDKPRDWKHIVPVWVALIAALTTIFLQIYE